MFILLSKAPHRPGGGPGRPSKALLPILLLPQRSAIGGRRRVTLVQWDFAGGLRSR
jgi:hypothetical protein